LLIRRRLFIYKRLTLDLNLIKLDHKLYIKSLREEREEIDRLTRIVEVVCMVVAEQEQAI
jgi:hypothetical protein